MPVLSLQDTADLAAAAKAAAAVLRSGKLAVIPTETVYGLVADESVPGAVERIYAAKQRERGKPLQLLISDVGVIARLGFELSPVARRLVDKFWPGGLTLVLEQAGRSEGFRMPDSEIALAVIREVGGALRATSANASGEPAALSAEAAREALGDCVALVLDGGDVVGGVASSVVRVGADGQVEVLREGAIKGDDILREAERV